jgi:hypothetical protein
MMELCTAAALLLGGLLLAAPATEVLRGKTP